MEEHVVVVVLGFRPGGHHAAIRDPAPTFR
jgi:hypothetical protein